MTQNDMATLSSAAITARVRELATAAGLAGSLPRGGSASFDFPAFWRHSFGTALCAQALQSIGSVF